MEFAEIEDARKKAGLTVFELSRRANAAPSTYWFIRIGKTKPRRNTLDRYAKALGTAFRAAEPDDPVRSTYRAHLAFAASAMGLDPAQVTDRPDAREFWRARAVALACVAADLNLRHAQLGRALGLSKQIVNWNIKQAMAMTDDPRLAWFAEKSGRFQEAAE